MRLLQASEALAWAGAVLLMAALVRDAWRIGRRYDETLLTSSREGEIENDLREVAAGLEAIEDGVERRSGDRP